MDIDFTELMINDVLTKLYNLYNKYVVEKQSAYDVENILSIVNFERFVNYVLKEGICNLEQDGMVMLEYLP